MIKMHRYLLRTVIAITILILALSASVIVQQLNGDIRIELDSFLYIPPAGLAVVLAFLSIPKLRYDAVVAPNRVSHIAAQVLVSVCGAALITWAGLTAFHAPLARWLAQVYMAPLLAVGCGVIYIFLGVSGCLCAIWPRTDENTNYNVSTLHRVHIAARTLAAIFACVISGIILGSTLIFNSPTTPFTMFCAIIMLLCAVILGWSRFGVASIISPAQLWHIGPQFIIAVTAAYIIERTTRAFLFHTHLFQSFADINVVYPRFENLLMLPFIVFGLSGIALAMGPRKQVKLSETEVFS